MMGGLRLEGYVPAEADFKRMGDGLDTYTESKGGPAYVRRFFAFRALHDGAVAGELAGSLLWGQADVKMLIVNEDARGRGVGGALLDAAARFARENGAKGITLWTASWQGEGFYERHGYREMGRIPLAADRFDTPQYKIFYHLVL